MRILRALKQSVSQFTRMVFQEASYRILSMLPSGVWNYKREVGDGMASSVITAPLFWLMRTFPEAPPILVEIGDPKDRIIRDDGRGGLLRLLQKPNDFYTGVLLWMATIADWKVDGNAYWLVVRNALGTPTNLWWTPSWMMEPKGDAQTFISHYEYRVSGRVLEVRNEDVVHFRFGMDPDNPKRGISPLKSVLREVFTDDEAARFTSALLRNMGVPGIVVSPDTDNPPSDDDVKATKAYIKDMFSGDRRGEPLVLSGKTQVEQFGFSPDQLILRELRRIPEERTTAVMGVPAIVAGLGAGLDRSTFTNYNEARAAAYEESIIPTQRIFAEDIRFQLMPAFGVDPWKFHFGFDLSRVRVLQQDEIEKSKMLSLGVRDGYVQVAEAREHVGLPFTDADQVYLRALNTQAVPVSEQLPNREADRPNSQGNGATAPEIAQEVVREMARQGA